MDMYEEQVDRQIFEEQSYSERRVERAAFETDRLLVVADVTLPPAGYQSRFSDSLNRSDLEFLPLTDCEVTSLADGATSPSWRCQSATSASPIRSSVDRPNSGASERAAAPLRPAGCGCGRRRRRSRCRWRRRG
jgi:hypothetical protein